MLVLMLLSIIQRQEQVDVSEWVNQNQNSSYQGKFQWNFNQGKGNIVDLGGNSSYPSKNDWKVGWNPREVGLRWRSS